MEAAGGDSVISFGDLLRVIRKRLWVILLMTIASVGVAVAFSLAQTPIYESSIDILVGQERGISETPNDALGLQQLTQTMSAGVGSRRMGEAVIDREGLRTTPEDFLEEDLSVEQVPNTQLIRVDYRHPNPERARRVANTVGAVFSEQVSEVSQSANSITATVWDPAVTPDEPVSPNPIRNALLALALGLMLGVGLAFLLEYFDESWHSPEEAERLSGVPVYGVIPQFEVVKGTWVSD
jgi:capsular polysaccharide biosynthesis protein